MALTKITPQMFDTSATAHDLNVDNGTFVVDGSASRVGIGTATPSTLLDVNGTATATTFVGALTGNVTGNVSGTAATVTGAAQANITSLGTLTALTVDNITLNGSTISSGNNGNINFPTASSGNADISFDGSNFTIVSNSSSANLKLQTNSQDALTIAGNGTATFASALVTGSTITAGSTIHRGNMTIDSQEIDVGSGNLTFDVAGHIVLDSADEIKLDSHNGIIRVQTQGGDIGMIRALNSDLQIRSMVADKDIVFYGNDSDGGGGFTALTLDMSAVGAATFAGPVLAPAGSASIPSLSFSGDPNTGLYSVAGDNIGFAIGGSARAFLSATQFNVTGNGIFSGTGSFGGTLSVTGDGDFSSEVKVGANNSLFAENVIRFYSGGAAYFDHGTTGQNFNFRVGNSSALDTTALTLTSTGLSYFPYFLGVRASARWNGSAPAYSLTISADNSGNAIEVFRTSNSKMLQYMSADGKYYFDMYGSATPEIRFRNNGTDWMRTQGTRLFVGGSAPVTLGAGASGGTGSNQTLLQVQGAVDMGYQGRYTACIWGPTTVSSSTAYTHLKTGMWGGGSPHGNAEYIMGGFVITGYRYAGAGSGNMKEIHQFHNWSGSLYNYTKSSMLDNGNSWSGTGTIVLVYVGSDGHVYIRLPSDSASYRMYMVDYIQYSQYGKVDAGVLAVTASNSTTV